MDDSVAFGQGGAAFQLEGQAPLLQAEKAMHNPVVFFDQGRIDSIFPADNEDKIGEIGVVVEEIRRHGSR